MQQLVLPVTQLDVLTREANRRRVEVTGAQTVLVILVGVQRAACSRAVNAAQVDGGAGGFGEAAQLVGGVGDEAGVGCGWRRAAEARQLGALEQAAADAGGRRH